MNNTWPPPFQYNGPYPRHKLAEARQILVSSLNTRSNILEKLKPKIGLASSMGPALVPPPIPGCPSMERGFGASSNNFIKHFRNTEAEYDNGNNYAFQNYSDEYSQDFSRGNNPRNRSFDDANFSGANHWELSSKNNLQNMGNTGTSGYNNERSDQFQNLRNWSQLKASAAESSTDTSCLRNWSQLKASAAGSSTDTSCLRNWSQLKASAASGSSTDKSWSPCIPINNSNLKDLMGNNTKIHLNNTWPSTSSSRNSSTTPEAKSNETINFASEMAIPVYYSGVINQTSTPKSATVSRPHSRNESVRRSESPVEKFNTAVNTICNSNLRLVTPEKIDSKVFTSERGFQSRVAPSQSNLQVKRKSIEENEYGKKQKLSDGSANSSNNRKSQNLSPTKISIFKGDHNNLQDTFKIYKCDFCKATASTIDGLNKHLISSKHFSGSLYKARDIDTGIELVSIAEMLVAKNNSSTLQCFVVSCPECKTIFDDIFTCGLHSRNMHDVDMCVYCICPVVNVQTVWLNKVPKCIHCSQLFNTHFELNSHWNTEKSHSPCPQNSNSQMFTLTLCPFCDDTFRGNFTNAISHVIQKHHAKIDGPTFSLQVKEILEPRKQEELPEFDDSCMKSALQMELSVLRNIEKSIYMTPNSKTTRKQIKNKLSKVQYYLQKLL